MVSTNKSANGVVFDQMPLRFVAVHGGFFGFHGFGDVDYDLGLKVADLRLVRFKAENARLFGSFGIAKLHAVGYSQYTCFENKAVDCVMVGIQQVFFTVGDDMIWIKFANECCQPVNFILVFQIHVVIIIVPKLDIADTQARGCGGSLGATDCFDVFRSLAGLIPKIVRFSSDAKAEHDNLNLCAVCNVLGDGTARTPDKVCGVSTYDKYILFFIKHFDFSLSINQIFRIVADHGSDFFFAESVV
ncbi:hypothetical protein SDC9_169206 [bioreactor metagenome]|uniref:Uncharacterized protein n=1 Tax=bioreactor metagenome TaxID=1076179 RepID=A0A645GCT0_9ZZZZ